MNNIDIIIEIKSEQKIDIINTETKVIISNEQAAILGNQNNRNQKHISNQDEMNNTNLVLKVIKEPKLDYIKNGTS